MNPTITESRQLADLIHDIRFAMFTTRDAQGHLCARPMTTQHDQSDSPDQLWFFMSRNSEPVRQLQQDPNVNVSYADPDSDRYVSVAGVAAEVNDHEKKQQLWSTMNQAWFPQGVDDPELALVKVDITQAEFWDVKESKVTQLAKMAKAVVTGTPPTDMGEHGKVKVS